MNLGGGLMGSMSLPSSTMTRKPVDGGSDPFPAGLRVLVVDDDPTCLIILEKMLRTCRYDVTKTNRAEFALSLLRENKNGFDIVISDVHMPDMDGFKLLEHVGLEMDLPVIMMSADDSKSVVMKGVTHGACDYLIKPVRIEALKNIWQHVVRKKKNEWRDVEQSSSYDEGDRQQKQDDVVSSPANEGSWKSSKRKAEDDDADEKDDTSTLKKPRVVWSVELHQQFVAAVNQLGIDKAVPKKILELMNVPGLTRENVASHLQKYRLYLRRLSGVSQHQGGGLNGSFMSQDGGFGAMSQLSGIDLQALHATAQLSSQTLAAYTRLPPIKPSMSMPFADQRNLFSFENTATSRYVDGQQQQQQQYSKQMNLLHGIPTTLESKQLAGLNQSAQIAGLNQSAQIAGLNQSAQISKNVNLQGSASSSHHTSTLLMPVVPQHSRGQVLNENVTGHVSRTQPSNRVYNRVSPAGRLVDYSINQIPDLPGTTSFPLGSTPGLTSLASKGVFNQEDDSHDIKAMRGYVGSYDVFPEAHKAQDWQVRNPNMVYGVSGPSSKLPTSVQSSINVTPGNPMFSSGLDNHHLGMTNISHNGNGILVDSTPRVKAEKISDVVSPGTNLFTEHYTQDDLMSALFKQHDGIGSGEYDFDGYSLDNIPV